MIQSYGYTHDALADPREILVRHNFIYGMLRCDMREEKNVYSDRLTKLPGHP